MSTSRDKPPNESLASSESAATVSSLFLISWFSCLSSFISCSSLSMPERSSANDRPGNIIAMPRTALSALDVDASAVLRHYPVYHVKSEAGAGPHRLCREERVEYLVHLLFRYAVAGVRHDRLYERPLLPAAERQRAPAFHGVDGVNDEGDEYLLELHLAAVHERAALEGGVYLDRTEGGRVPRQLERVLYRLREIHPRFNRVLRRPGIIRKLPYYPPRVLRVLYDVLV